MSTILVVDDKAIFREPIAASLRLQGYQTRCASDGLEALEDVRRSAPDLILLDLAMPRMDGITFLKHLRADKAVGGLPVILLTALSDKHHIIEAASLGVKDYLLKSSFRTEDLIERIEKKIGSPGADVRGSAAAPNDIPGARPTPASPSTPGPAPADAPVGENGAAATSAGGAPAAAHADAEPRGASAPADAPAGTGAGRDASGAPSGDARPAGGDGEATPELPLTREQSVERVEKVFEGRTLSGAVAHVISLAGSPDSDLAQLAGEVQRDPILSARILQAANSAAYTSKRGVISSVTEAVRNIGVSTVRNIASTIGIYEVMPPPALDGFSPVLSWQHSLAVAKLCEHLAQHIDTNHGIPYLVGLCHDLGEILFRTSFATEYEFLLNEHERTGASIDELERRLLGISHGEIVDVILSTLKLPPPVCRPIAAHGSGGDTDDPVAITLRIADECANGLLLATGGRATVAPVLRSECKAVFGEPDPEMPDPTVFRSEILALTLALARMSSQDMQSLTKPLYPKTERRIWLARHAAFSSLCPVATALRAMAEVEVSDRLPTPDDAASIDALVVVSPSPSTSGFNADAVAAAAGPVQSPVLWLVRTLPQQSAPAGTNPDDVTPRCTPVSLSELAEFVGVNEAPVRRAA